MRTTRALAASVAAVAVVGLGAPTAAAWSDPTSVTAQPSVIARGGQLTLTVQGEACTTRDSTISSNSNAFPTTRLRSMGGNQATATVTINSNAAPGANSVTTHCEGRTKTFNNVFTIVGGVRGGLGGSSSSGATPTDVAIGGGLVTLALIGGGVFWMRRRSENRI
jgi:hypothetical protein